MVLQKDKQFSAFYGTRNLSSRLHKNFPSSSLTQTVTLLISIRKLFGSNLGQNDYPDWDFSWFSLALPGKFRLIVVKKRMACKWCNSSASGSKRTRRPRPSSSGKSRDTAKTALYSWGQLFQMLKHLAVCCYRQAIIFMIIQDNQNWQHSMEQSTS